jgi:hypothetical protein
VSVLQELNTICQSSNSVNRIAVERSEKLGVDISKDGILSVRIPDDSVCGLVPIVYDLLTVSENCAEFDEYVGNKCTKYQMLISGGSLHVDIRAFKPQRKII